MKIIKEINDTLRVIEDERSNFYVLVVNDAELTQVLSVTRSSEEYEMKVASNDDYIISYTSAINGSNYPLSIEGAYDIKNREVLDLDEAMKAKLDRNVLFKIGIKTDVILSIINKNDLRIANDQSINDVIDYLTNNKYYPIEAVINYIYSCYPELIRYSNLNGPLSMAEYDAIMKDLPEYLSFHSMPVNIVEKGNKKELSI